MYSNEDLIAEARRLEDDYGDNYEVVTHMSVLADALESVRAERDAATAAVERVRAIHYLDPYIGVFVAKRCVCEESWPCSTIQALDGGDSGE